MGVGRQQQGTTGGRNVDSEHCAKEGWVIDDALTASYKAFLAGRRQGDIPADVKFEKWIDNVAGIQYGKGDESGNPTREEQPPNSSPSSP